MKTPWAKRFGGFLVSALLIAFAAPPPVARATTEPCGDVHVIWARGSGAQIGSDAQFDQFYSTDLTGPNGRIGAGVTVSAYQLGQDGGFGGFQYPAAGDNWTLVTGGFPILGPEYENSVGQGRQELVAYATDRVANCPNEVLMLAGFSQGAQVVGEGLETCRRASVIGSPTLHCSATRRS
jgi:hypothetical protein